MKRYDFTWMLMIILVTVDVLLHLGESNALSFSCIVSMCGTLLLLLPGKGNRMKHWIAAPLILIVVTVALMCLASFLQQPLLLVAGVPAANSLTLVAVSFFSALRMFLNENFLFYSGNVWRLVEEQSLLISRMIMLLLQQMIIVASFSEGRQLFVSGVLFGLLSLAFYVILFNMAWKSRLLLLDEKKALFAKNILKETMRDIRAESNGKRMTALFKDIEDYMSTEQPYLNSGMSLNDLAIPMMTNRTYVSQTINVMFGKNFRQYVNHYRVEHAKRLMKKSGGVRMQKLAMESGFNTVPAFNMAFRMCEGMTPTQWFVGHQANLWVSGEEEEATLEEEEL